MSNMNAQPKGRVNLFIEGKALKDLDTFSKSDPCCRVFSKHGHNGAWYMVG